VSVPLIEKPSDLGAGGDLEGRTPGTVVPGGRESEGAHLALDEICSQIYPRGAHAAPLEARIGELADELQES
jgi:hypothetical protein